MLLALRQISWRLFHTHIITTHNLPVKPKCPGMQFEWKKALTLICRRLQGCVARTGGRARMSTEKARRSLPAAGRAEQPG